ncbi:MAG: flagellar biosynthesis protein FlhB [Planctomycetales bacterium]|nr:flagellar biosynthesis protein FlhB [Planctomycetales bacterium]
MDSQQSKTEAPTQRRRDEARRRGQLATSSDLATGLVLLVLAVVFWSMGEMLGGVLFQVMRAELLGLDRIQWGSNEVIVAGRLFGIRLFYATAAVVISLFLANILVYVLQNGIQFSSETLEFKWDRLLPTNGFQRLFSMRTTVRGIMAILKVIVITCVVFFVMRNDLGQIYAIGFTSVNETVATTWNIVIKIIGSSGLALTTLGIGDYLFQRWQHEVDLRMTLEEVKREHKETEGDPHLKARLKKIQRETANRRMMKNVPGADAVVRNPTHFAVALKYDQEAGGAPKVVAKGADFLALRIIEIAEQHDVPVLERKPLARALYRMVEVGDEIPVEMYQAIAELLAYVYRLKSSL